MKCIMSDALFVLFIVVILTVYDDYIKRKKEGFWNYNTRRQYFQCKYGQWHPNRCSKLMHTFHHFKKTTQANPVGYIYSDNGNKTYPLLGWYDGYANRYKYYVKDYKSPYSHEYILIELDTRGRQIYDGDTVKVKGHDGDFIVKKQNQHTLAHYNPFGTGTRYDYHAVPWRKTGYIKSQSPDNDNHNRFFMLFEKELDPRRGEYKYKVQTHHGYDVYLDMGTRNKYLEDGDIITVPGLPGQYVVNRYSYETAAFF